MAFQWIKLGGEFGPYDKACLDELRQRRDAFLTTRLKIFDLKELIIKQRDGDSSQASHYAEIAERHATQDITDGAEPPVILITKNQQAKSFGDEIEACCGILSNPASTIAQVNAAVDQVLAMLNNA